MNDDHGNRNTREALLVLKIAIDCEQNVELTSGQLQQLAVLHAGPADLGNGLDLVPRNLVAEHARDALVKQHSHRQSGARSPGPAPRWQFRASQWESLRETRPASGPLSRSRSA